MRIIKDILEMQSAAESLRRQGKKIGVVPTMGSLHAGHLSLIKIARSQSDAVITTLFVNPTQFGPGEDFELYPRDPDRDNSLAAEAGTDFLFAPDTREMYPDGYATFVEVVGVSSILEGNFRPNHFRGVTTVVAKLFLITRPHVAVFGQKDAQQAFVIQKMTKDINFDLSVVVAPIIREEDGLALSSRNVYLSPEERSRAASLYKSLKHVETRIGEGERSVAKLRSEMTEILLRAHPSQIDYVAFIQPDSFREIEALRPPSVLIALAVRFGSTRLIDNLMVSTPGYVRNS